MNFFGRDKELALLRKIRDDAKHVAHFTIVTGRRRIGKTELLRQAYGDDACLYFFVARRTEKDLCESFKAEIGEKLGEFIPGEQTRFAEIFRWILAYSRNRPITLVIDEFQDFLRVDSGICSEMQREWDALHGAAKINLVVCGSVNSLMNKMFRDKKEPLYRRETAFLKVRPFPPSQLKVILGEHSGRSSSDDLLSLYALTGGVAKYVSLLMDAGAVTTKSMLAEMISDGSPSVGEGRAGLVEEFGRDYGTYFSILTAIACGKTLRSEIESATGVRELGGYLKRLESDYEIIRKTQPLFAKSQAKNARYAINDEFYRFWFRYIARYSAAIELGAYDRIRAIIERDWTTFTGKALERYFIAKLGETGNYTRIGGWWDRKGENEIDIIAENEFDEEVEFYEVKRNEKRFSPKLLEAKRDVFLRASGQYEGWTTRCLPLSLADM
jgi:AAA+ ATPase superfamily predicted ATPase